MSWNALVSSLFCLAVGVQLSSVFARSLPFPSLFQSTASADQTSACPVTLRPEKAFVPPSPYLRTPPEPVSFWYGTRGLWTQVWAPPPWTPWKAQQKARMYWASIDTSNMEQPTLVVSIRRIGADEQATIFAAPDAVSYTTKRFGMIAEVTFPSPGCWQVTGQYHGNSLSYVVQIEPPASPSSSPADQVNGVQAKSSGQRQAAVERGPPTEVRTPVLAWRLVPNISCHTSPRGSASFINERGCAAVCGGTKGPPCTEKQQRRLEELEQQRRDRFFVARKLLLKAGVPFDPDILLEVGGRSKLLPVLDQMPEMKRDVRTNFLSGVVMADTLYVSGPIALGLGPTVVLVNHVVSEGCTSFEKNQAPDRSGTDDLYWWPLEPTRVLGMSLKDALAKNGLTVDEFAGSNYLPSYSVIRALNLPKVRCYNGDFVARDPGPTLWPF